MKFHDLEIHALNIDVDRGERAASPSLGQRCQRSIVDVLTAIEVELFEIERVRVVCDDPHGILVYRLAVAQAQNSQLI